MPVQPARSVILCFPLLKKTGSVEKLFVENVAGGGEMSNCQPGMCNKIFDFLFKINFCKKFL